MARLSPPTERVARGTRDDGHCIYRNACRPDVVFDYISDAAPLPEWQDAVQNVVIEPRGLWAWACAAAKRRRVPGGRRTFGWEVTEFLKANLERTA